MIKPIITDKDKLNKKSIKCIDTLHIINDLIDTAKHHSYNCAGLAANQIGYNCTIFVIKIKNQFIPIVNPTIISKSKQIRYGDEGCLSFPGKKSRVRRHLSISVTYFDPIKNKIITRKKLKNRLAIVFQHEYDHLQGILI